MFAFPPTRALAYAGLARWSMGEQLKNVINNFTKGHYDNRQQMDDSFHNLDNLDGPNMGELGKGSYAWASGESMKADLLISVNQARINLPGEVFSAVTSWD
jgi:hypothetical protein